MSKDIRVFFGDKYFPLTATVDVDHGVVYDVTIWKDCKPVQKFRPSESRTPLEIAALDRIMFAYGICPVLE